jgi:membrane fusion protein (multidrug efflux system)
MSVKKWAVTITGCVLAFGGLATYKVLDIRAAIAFAAAYPEQSETVEVAVAAPAEYTPSIAVMGEVVAPQRLDLRNEIGGEITAVNFRSGDQVKKGQLLIQLDVSVEQANLKAARAKADVARLVYQRISKLLETRVATQDQADKAKADLTAAEAEISVLERTIDKKTLRAPFDGRAGLHNFEVGQYLEGNTVLTSLVGDTAEMWVDFQMPQFYPQLPVGTTVSVSTIGENSTTSKAAATVIAENTVLNANSRSRGYRASIASNAQQYAPSTVVQLQVPIAAPEPLLQVPALSVQNDPLGQYVFVLHSDGNAFRASRQQVQVKLIENERALIANNGGLKQGDQVAAAGAFKLYEGILVHIGDRPATDAAADTGVTGSP